jgi:hypothetical protein
MYDIYLLSLSLPQIEDSLHWYRHSSRGRLLTTFLDLNSLILNSGGEGRYCELQYEAPVNLFECIQRFLQRLNHYTAVSVMPEMTALLANIMAQILSILALLTRAMKERRISRSIQSMYTLG